MQTGTLLQELKEEEEKFESVSDHSKTVTIESTTATREGFLIESEINIQAQPSKEIKEDANTEKETFLQTEPNLSYLDKSKFFGPNEMFSEQLSKYKKIQLSAVRKKSINIILLGLSFGGGMAILLSGIIFANGFLSWIGVLFMSLGVIHLTTS